MTYGNRGFLYFSIKHNEYLANVCYYFETSLNLLKQKLFYLCTFQKPKYNLFKTDLLNGPFVLLAFTYIIKMY